MSFNLLESVKNIFSGSLISTAASSLGESEGGIQKAITGAIPAVLAGLVSKAGTYEGAGDILHMSKQAADSGILNNINDFLGNNSNNVTGQGAEMLKGIVGDKAGGVASVVADYAGVKHSSSSALLSMIAPAALGVLGKHASDAHLNADGLLQLLASQKASIINAMPAGLSAIAGLFGAGAATAHHTVSAASHATVHHTEEAVNNSSKFLVPLLLGVFAVALGIYFFKGCEGQPKELAGTSDTAQVTTAHSEDGHQHAAATTSRELFRVTLPNDTVLEAYKGGIEDKLVAFLGTDYKKLGEDSLKKIWFDFDNLNFETASAVITPESQVQVNNIAAILKAFPSAGLKIGGYTDKVGNEEDNKKLSDARAKAVQAALQKAGVGKQVIGAEGYGSAFAAYSADAPESDRLKDRHVSVSVR